MRETTFCGFPFLGRFSFFILSLILSLPFDGKALDDVWETKAPQNSICRLFAGETEERWGAFVSFEGQRGVITLPAKGRFYLARFREGEIFCVGGVRSLDKSPLVFCTLLEDSSRSSREGQVRFQTPQTPNDGTQSPRSLQSIKPLRFATMAPQVGDAIFWPNKSALLLQRVSWLLGKYKPSAVDAQMEATLEREGWLRFQGKMAVAGYDGGPLFNRANEIVGFQNINPLTFYPSWFPIDYAGTAYLSAIYLLTAFYKTEIFFGSMEGILVRTFSRFMINIPERAQRMLALTLLWKNAIRPFLLRGSYVGREAFGMISLPNVRTP